MGRKRRKSGQKLPEPNGPNKDTSPPIPTEVPQVADAVKGNPSLKTNTLKDQKIVKDQENNATKKTKKTQTMKPKTTQHIDKIQSVPDRTAIEVHSYS
jgi:hypothetical protein